MHIEIFVAFFVTSACLWALRPLALNAGLVDRPGGHKIHDGEIPLIGGIAMYLGMLAALLLSRSFPAWQVFLISSGLLLVIGAVDDFRELRVTVRMVAQLVAGLIMAIGADNILVSLGDLFGAGNVELGAFAIPFTLLCVIGVINAMNMSDGMDGLAGSLALIAILLIMAMVALSGGASFRALIVFPAVLVPFLIVNLCGGRSCGRAFMGDAGSTFLGFALAWVLIAYSQGDDAVYRPVTALWFMAVPIIDTVSLMIRRVLKGRSPFLPDRQHFHHVLIAAGLGTRQTLAVVVVLALLLGGLGIAGELAGVPEWQMAAAFVTLGFLYLFAVQHAWRVKRALGRLLA